MGATGRTRGVAAAAIAVLALGAPIVPEPPASDGLALPTPLPPRPVLEAAHGPPVGPGRLASRIGPLLADPRLGGRVGFAAYDLRRGRLVWARGDQRRYTPASTLKLLTTLAALAVLGPDRTFATRVVEAQPRARRPRVVLVGGGDPLLARRPPPASTGAYPRPATLSTLVTRTVRSLRTAHHREVRVGYDAGLFSGPAVSPRWEPSYVPDQVVTPISALWVDQGVVGTQRVADPARAAAQDFAAALRARGVRVSGRPVAVVTSSAGGALATVRSPPLEQIVQSVLERSDNEGAEVLLRDLAIATGRPGSFSGGVAALRAVLVPLGIPWRGLRLYDGSGLARSDRVTTRALLAAIAVAADRSHPQLRGVIAGLPVAGFSGSLAYRFSTPAARSGRGYARAKTGTLAHVNALVGATVDKDGSELAFVALADRVRIKDTLAARDQLDRIAAAVASCGCAASAG